MSFSASEIRVRCAICGTPAAVVDVERTVGLCHVELQCHGLVEVISLRYDKQGVTGRQIFEATADEAEKELWPNGAFAGPRREVDTIFGNALYSYPPHGAAGENRKTTMTTESETCTAICLDCATRFRVPVDARAYTCPACGGLHTEDDASDTDIASPVRGEPVSAPITSPREAMKPETPTPPDGLLDLAVDAASTSPCQKSKRGVVLWWPGQNRRVVTGHNFPATGSCDGSEPCRRDCGEICVHAEQSALFNAPTSLVGSELLHIKVVDGQPVAGGPPSCVDCSKLMCAFGVGYVWLLEEGKGWIRRTAADFHMETLRNKGLHCAE